MKDTLVEATGIDLKNISEEKVVATMPVQRPTLP
jgi:hypothetical protein